MPMVFAIVNAVRDHLDEANEKLRDNIVASRVAAAEKEQELELVRHAILRL